MDELHLMLRISDILMRNLVWAAQQRNVSNITETVTTYTDLLVSKIRCCGVTFHVSSSIHFKLVCTSYYIVHSFIKYIQIWNSKEKKDKLEWTSLRGADHRTLLERFPPHIPAILGENGTQVMNLWKVHVCTSYYVCCKLLLSQYYM